MGIPFLLLFLLELAVVWEDRLVLVVEDDAEFALTLNTSMISDLKLTLALFLCFLAFFFCFT